jgi:hypothetical protein
VEKATKADIALIAATDPRLAASGLAATALALSRELDAPSNSATSKSMCAKALMDALDQLRTLTPAEEDHDKVDDLAKQREARRARVADATRPARP